MKPYQRLTISTYNKHADIYEKIRRPLMPSVEARKFINLLQGKLIMDAGSGPGRDSGFFAKIGYNMIAVDLSMEFLRLNQKTSNEVKCIMGDISNPCFPSNTFDGIWCNAVLSHFKKSDISEPLKQLYRVLKKGGILFLSVKEGTGEGIQFENEFNNAPRYMAYYREFEILERLTEQGFSVTDSYIYNEMERCGNDYRNIDFIFCFVLKN